MRRPTIIPGVATIAVLMLPVAARAQSASLEGSVVDGATASPVAAAEVMLRAVDRDWDVRVITSDGGQFKVSGLTPGRFVARVERVGYLVREDTVELGDGAIARLDIALAADPVLLPGVSAEGRPRAPLGAMAGFWERRESISGHFITREDIDRQRPHRMADLIRRVPGAQIHAFGDGQVAIFMRVRNADGRPCIPAMFVDGVPYVMTERGLDDFNPSSIEAVEVYSGSSRIPAQFNTTGRDQPRWRPDQIIGNPRCGVIVLWTRRT